MSAVTTAPVSDDLNVWLAYIEGLHAKPIDLGLDRMRTMIERLGIRFTCPVFTVAGTNGKGSTCTMLAGILRAQGYKVGVHTSPHLFRFNERVLIDGKEVTDQPLLESIRRVERLRGGMTLTYFEYTGLAILDVFSRAGLDAVILEIGLGGRLDAMNVIDTNCGIVTAVDVDHEAFLGSDRGVIAYEKSCIYRADAPAVCTDRNVPINLIDNAAAIGCELSLYGRDFETVVRDDGFDWTMTLPDGEVVEERALPLPGLRGRNQIQNAAGVLAALTRMRDRLPVSRTAMENGLARARIKGRFERVVEANETTAELTIDVGHNPNAAEALVENLAIDRRDGQETWAVFGMLADKDMQKVASLLKNSIDRWFVAGLTGPRAATASLLSEQMMAAGIDSERIATFDTVETALAECRALASAKLVRDQARTVRIIAFGSFVTVAAVLEALGETQG